ncbi:MAG TPA: PKD domain-containing protein, partial [Flavipsychrobacter sp.]|nr:PKD domain-containing protein [Flavipsychrobacter sp.]
MDKRLRFLGSILLLVLAFTTKVFAQAPVANFTLSSTSGCMPSAPFTFTNTTTGSGPITYTWNFGTTLQPNSNGVNATINANIVGTHTITLTATNSFGSNSISKTITVNPQPIVSFLTFDTAQTCPPKLVNFTNNTILGTAGAGTYSWVFGDGNTSSATNPSNNYASGGNFNVTLTATNSAGCSNFSSINNYIKVPLLPIPNFTSSNNIACSVPATVNFTNTSANINSTTVNTWNFGNGTQTSVGTASVANTYATAGFYTVTLTAANGLCSASTTKAAFVEADVLIPNFTYAPSNICKKTPVSFTNTTTPSTGTSTWYFGDGDSAVGTNAVHAYQSSGTFTVTLKVLYKGCIKTTTQTITVAPAPTTSPTITPTACTTPLMYNFNATVVGGNTYLWNFGDGATSTSQNVQHTYLASGMYTAIFTATNTTTGCSTIDTINFYAGKPVVSIRDSGNHCDSLPIYFWATKNP